MTGEQLDPRAISYRPSLSIEDSASGFLSIKYLFISYPLDSIMNVLFFVRDVFLFYFRLKLSKAHSCDLYVFINSDLVIRDNEILPRLFAYNLRI